MKTTAGFWVITQRKGVIVWKILNLYFLEISKYLMS